MISHTQFLTRRAFLGGIAALGVLSFTQPLTAFAVPTAAEKQAEAQSAFASLSAMQVNLDRVSNDYHEALLQLEQAQAGMKQSQERIDAANDKIGSLQKKLGTRASSMYRNGNTTFLDLLLGAATFEEFSTNWDLLNKMNQSDADMVQETKDLRVEIEAQKQEYTRLEAVASAKTAEAKKIKDEAEATMRAMQATYDGLSAEAADLLAQERAAQTAAEAAQAQSVVDAASSGGSSSAPPYSPVTGNAVVDRAYGCLGRAYDAGACGPNSFDCSGLVGYALTGSYSRVGSTYTFLGWSRVSDPQPGDVAVNSGHCGIYIGGGQMIHASTYGVGVIVGPVQSGMVFVRW